MIRSTNNHQSDTIRVATDETNLDLIQGVFGHLQTLVKLHILLTRREIEEEVRKRIAAVIVLAVGAGCVMLAALMLSLAFAHGLHWMTLPTELQSSGLAVSGLPLWSCHAIVSLALALLGATLITIGRKKISSVAPFQHNSRNPLQANRS